MDALGDNFMIGQKKSDFYTSFILSVNHLHPLGLRVILEIWIILSYAKLWLVSIWSLKPCLKLQERWMNFLNYRDHLTIYYKSECVYIIYQRCTSMSWLARHKWKENTFHALKDVMVFVQMILGTHWPWKFTRNFLSFFGGGGSGCSWTSAALGGGIIFFGMKVYLTFIQ